MVIVSRSIHIDAPVERVFALIADPAARASLNPDATAIRAEIEGSSHMHAGAVCHYRMRIDDRIVDYRTHVSEFELNRLITAVSDSTVPFEVRIETVSEDSGTRLTQTESFEPTDALLRQALPETLNNSATRFVHRLMMFLDVDAALRLRQRQEDALGRMLERKMDRWLLAIKESIEGEE